MASGATDAANKDPHAERLKEWRNITFNIAVGLLIIAIIALEAYFVRRFVPVGITVADLLKLVGLLVGLPILLVLAVYERIEKQTVGIILTAVISFSLGQAASTSPEAGARSNTAPAASGQN